MVWIVSSYYLNLILEEGGANFKVSFLFFYAAPSLKLALDKKIMATLSLGIDKTHFSQTLSIFRHSAKKNIFNH